MKIDLLANHLQFKEQVIHWLKEEFGGENSRPFYEGVIENSLKERALPITFIAFNHEELIGTIGIWRGDLLSRQDLFPWISALVVRKDYRNKGVGKELQKYALDYCFSQNFKEAYLYTDIENYYEKSGWELIDEGYEYSGDNVRIYKHKLNSNENVMLLRTKRIIIRPLESDDIESLYRIVWQKNMVRFMKDWSENNPNSESFEGYIAWQQSKKASIDIYENKRYAVALADTNKLIGMVGMGLEDTLNEVEMAYFIDEEYQGCGYASEALELLTDWCFKVSDIQYLILTIDCANEASCRVAEKTGFEMFEKRTPMGHTQPNMESESYYYYRKYRK